MKASFRKVGKKDLERLREIVDDPEVSHYLCLIPPVKMKSTIEFYDLVRRQKDHWHAAVVDGKIAGSIWLHGMNSAGKQAHVTEFGISIAKEYQGMGVGDACMKYMISLARKLKYKRIYLTVVAGNKPAMKLYRKYSFRKEGTQKKAFKINGRYQDTIMMARLI
ncbi:GNAT family N-acetyltransferase [Candidatus Altiarchaeota archaeon]